MQASQLDKPFYIESRHLFTSSQRSSLHLASTAKLGDDSSQQHLESHWVLETSLQQIEQKHRVMINVKLLICSRLWELELIGHGAQFDEQSVERGPLVAIGRPARMHELAVDDLRTLGWTGQTSALLESAQQQIVVAAHEVRLLAATEHLVQRNAVRPDVRLGREPVVGQTLWRVPANMQNVNKHAWPILTLRNIRGS